MASLFVGESVEVTGTYRLDGTTLADPTTLTVVVVGPDSAETTYIYLTDSEVSRLSIGLFLCRITATSSGHWTFRFTFTTAGIIDIETISVNVNAVPA